MSGAILGLLAVMVAVVPPFILPASALPVTIGPNEVTNWSNFNYEGYQGQTSYPEFHSLMQTMSDLGERYGCGRAMWEYSASENRFGTPEALMLLPFETNGCIDSMEGLLFESSATTPYHFLNQAELSAGPSEPEVGLPYGALNVTLGRAAPAAARREVLHGGDAASRAGGRGRSLTCSSSPRAARGPTTTAAPTPRRRGRSTW